jgi:hypothetical protein
LQRIAPDPMIRPLVLSVELHYLTEQLDERLLDVLVNQLGLADSISVPLYAEGYRLCNNYNRRVQQIELIHELGSLIDDIVRLPLSGAMLRLAKAPLERGGWHELMGFMDRGYDGFKQMHGGRQLLQTVREREKRILDRIYAREADPFEFEASRPDEASG